MKKVSIFLLLAGLVVTVIIIKYMNAQKTHDADNPQVIATDLHTEQFIHNYLLTDDDLIRTNFHHNEDGDLILSESMGLWMKYLVEKNDQEQFDNTFKAVKNHLFFSNNLVSWRIKGREKAETNALIDDLRIIESLYKMGEAKQNNQYTKAAQKMAKAVVKYNNQDSFLVDFYDVKYGYADKRLTLSYLNFDAFKYMEKYNVISARYLKEIQDFMNKIRLNNGFYPEYYNFEDQTFNYEKTVNLIDQLYIAIYLEQADIDTTEFFTWLREVFYQQHVLYGRYMRQSKKEAVHYESAAVYALAIFYAIKKEDSSFATDLYEQMITLQVQDDTSSFRGGYVDDSLTETHSFDNLLSLLAERILINEQIIE